MTKIRLLFFIVILLGFINTLTAQAQIKDSTEVYNYWAHRGIIEMVYAYMNDYIETVGEAITEDEIIGKNKYERNYVSKIDNAELASFETISSFLKKNNWPGTEKKLFTPLVRNYENDEELDSNFFLAKKPGSNHLITTIPGYTNKNINWNQSVKTIISEYEKTLEQLNIEVITEQSEKETSQLKNTPPPKESTDNSNKTLNETNSDFNYIQYIKYLNIFLFIMVGIIIGFFVGRKHVMRKAKREIYDVLNDKTILENLGYPFSKDVFRLKEENNNLKNSNIFRATDKNNVVNLLKEENDKLRRQNDEFKRKESQLENDNQKLEIEQNTKNTYERETNQQKSLARKLFFSMPENDGSFIVDNGESSNDGRKYFRIEYIEGSEIGELFYIPGDRDNRAINRLESYLKPACDIDNIINADSATNIEFIKPGKVSLRNDSWVIDSVNKVKIKLV